ncbi:MAG: glycine zipper protein [Segetibacter sp.]|jgi:hypothetical protein|nr:glycine zipper protein [Segetibacter sp.]
MKTNILLVVAATIIFASCGNNKPVETTTTSTEIKMPDTSGLAEFQQLKEQQQNDMNIINEVPRSYEATPLTNNRPSRPAVVYRTAPQRQRQVARISKPAPRSTKKSGVRTSNDRYGNESAGSETSETTEPSVATQPTASTGTGVGTGPVVTAPTETPEVAKKKGWSKAAKGTAIGAGSGAVLGAIIGKNKGKGAVIGGIIGAAGGYVLGRGQDKKDGRYLTQ